MAWPSIEVEAMSIVCKHMQVMRLKKKRELIELYTWLVFPRQVKDWTDVKWTTHWGVTFVTMWDKVHLLENIQFAML